MTAERPFSSEEFKHLYSRVPRLCVDLVINNPDGLVLSLRTLPTWHGQWHFPGGTVLYNEGVAQAAARVAKQEIGAEIVIKKVLGYVEYPSEIKERGYGCSIGLALLCETQSTTFTHDEEASDVRAFAELPDGLIAEQRAFLDTHPDWRG